MEEIGLSGVFDLGNFDSGMNQYMSAIDKANGATAQTASGFGSAFSSIGSTVTNVMGGLVVNAFSSAASAVASFLPGAISAASDLGETISKVGVVFGDNAKQVDAWATTAATAMGQSQAQALAAAGTFGNLFVSMGMGTGPAADMSENLVQLAGDLASFNNIDPAVALEKLRAGVTGQAEPLKSLGVNINEAGIKAKALQLGLVGANGELTASAKAQAAYALIMEQTKTAQGDFARTSDGLANSQRINAAIWADLTAKIGGAFLPIMTKVSATVGQFLTAVGPSLTVWVDNLAAAIDAFVSGAPTDFPWEDILPAWLVPAAYAIAQTFEGLTTLVGDFMAGAVGFDYPWEDIFPPAVADIAYQISGAIEFISNNFDAFAGAIAGVAAVLAGSAIYTAIVAIGAAIGALSLPIVAIIGAAALLGAAWNANWFGIRDLTMPIIDAIGVALTDVGIVIKSFTEDVPGAYPWEDIFPGWLAETLHYISATIQGVQTVITDFHAGVFGFDYPWAEVFPPGVAEVLSSISTAIQATIQAFAPLASAIATSGAGAMNEIKNFVTGNETSFTNLTAIWNGLTQTASLVLGGLAGTIGAALPGVIAAFYNYATAAVSWIGNAIPGAITALGDYITGLINYLSGDGTTQVSGSTGGMVSALIDWITTQLIPQVGPAMLNFGIALVEAVGKIALALGLAAGQIGLALISAVAAHLPDWIASFAAWGAGALEWATTAIANAPAKITEWYTALTGAVSAHLPEWTTYFTSWSAPAVDWLSGATTNAPAKVSEWYTALSGTVQEKFPQWIVAFATWSAPATEWIATATTAAPGKIQAWYTALSGAITANLPALKTAMLTYAAALSAWVSDKAADATSKLTDWAGKITAWIPGAAATLRSNMLQFATSLVTWIGDNAADALPKLGQWLGKVLGWVTTAAATLATKMLEFSKALIGWISGTGGATSQADPEMDKFKTALLAALTKITAGFVEGVKAFVKAWSNAISDFDWTKLGTDVMGLLKTGVTAAQAGILALATTIATGIKTKFTEIDWVGLGTSILTFITNGVSAGAQTLYDKAAAIGAAALKKFTDIDWASIGKGIIDGIIAGLDAAWQKLKDKIASLTSLIPEWAKGSLGIQSPSKVFAEIGRNIVQGLIVGVGQMQRAAQKSIKDLVAPLTDFSAFFPINMDWASQLVGNNRSLEDYSSAFGDLISLGKDWAELNPTMNNGLQFGQTIASFDRYNSRLQDRIKLLDIIKSNNLDPSKILFGGDISNLNPEAMAQAIQQSATYVNAATTTRLSQEQKELQRLYDLRGALGQFNGQLELAATLGQNSMNFFQQVDFDQLSKKFAALGNELQQAQQVYTRTGDAGALARINALLAERQRILAQMQADQATAGTSTPNRDTLTAIMNQQSTLLDSAKNLGWNVSDIFTQYFANADNLSSDALNKMAMLQDAIDQANFDTLRKQLVEKGLSLDLNSAVTGVASTFAKQYSATVLDPLLARLRQVILLEDDRNTALAQYNAALGVTKNLQAKQDRLDFLQAQIDLVGKATGAGLSLSNIFAGITLGPGANITDLLTASNRLMDELVKKATQQLTPQALALADKQTQLANLKSQLDLFNQAQDAGLDTSKIFAGITLGINATTSDILTATTRLTDALIKQTIKDLADATPNARRAFADLGRNAVAGMGAGMDRAFANPLMRTSTVSGAPVSNRSLNFTMGGVNIYNATDEVMLEAKVQRIVERSIR